MKMTPFAFLDSVIHSMYDYGCYLKRMHTFSLMQCFGRLHELLNHQVDDVLDLSLLSKSFDIPNWYSIALVILSKFEHEQERLQYLSLIIRGVIAVDMKLTRNSFRGKVEARKGSHWFSTKYITWIILWYHTRLTISQDWFRNDLYI